VKGRVCWNSMAMEVIFYMVFRAQKIVFNNKNLSFDVVPWKLFNSFKKF
jgi:hypothetical protein